MTACVYRRPASKKRVPITPHLQQLIRALLATYSQQQVARQLGISQSAVNRVALSSKETGQ